MNLRSSPMNWRPSPMNLQSSHRNSRSLDDGRCRTMPLMRIMQFISFASIVLYCGIMLGVFWSNHHMPATKPPPVLLARILKSYSTEGVVNKEESLCDCADLERQVKQLKLQADKHGISLAAAVRSAKDEEQATHAAIVATLLAKQEKIRPADGKSSFTSTPDAFKSNQENFLAGAGGLSRVNKRAFMETHDYGWPLSNPDQSEALILHYSNASPTLKGDAGKDGPSGIPYYSKVEDATANCGEMLVVPIDKSGEKNKCFVLFSGYPSYHVGRFMRIGEDTKLQHINRIAPKFTPPSKDQIEKNWFKFSQYIAAKEVAHSTLDAILKSVAKNNTVIVMVCNIGQAVLLANFVCHGRQHGIPLDNLLVFATDEKTYQLATSLGVTSYFDKANFGHLPEKEAGSYGDDIFMQMMYAKVLTVQMVNYLGYDVLFQDVDMVWYKNPLELFHQKDGPLAEYDMLFQDDGSRIKLFAPYGANSGFYYVRHNPRTVYLFTSFMYHVDMIKAGNQQVLIQLMAEHASLFGLRVKVLEDKDFRCGFHFHRKKDLMKDMMKETNVPWVYHMSWTKNKTDKLKYLKQMGLWHVEEKCEDEKGLAVIDQLEGDPDKDAVFNACCSVEPLITCFYRDKPSKIPCKESPPKDQKGQSFW